MDNKNTFRMEYRVSCLIKTLAASIKRNKWTSILWAVFLLNGIFVSLFLYIFTNDHDTAAKFGLRFLQRILPSQDSWVPMYKALIHLHAFPDIPVYSKLFFAEHVKFQYPISSLLFLDLLQRIMGVSEQALYSILNLFAWVCVIFTGIVSWFLFRGSLCDSEPVELSSKVVGLSSLFAIMAITIAFYPLTVSYTLGQAQTAITFFVAAALFMWQRKRNGLAGFLLGLCCIIKPQWAVIIVWGLIRKEWIFVAASGLTFGVFTLISIGAYGFQQYVNYLPVLSYLSKYGESYYPNQSINGLMHRLLFNGNNLHWLETEFPPFSPVVYVSTLIAAILILGAALLWRRNSKAGTSDLALLLLSLTMSSPIAWDHHYAILLPMFALIAPACISKMAIGRYSGAYLLVAFFLTSQRFNFVNRFADTYLNFLQSTIFFGALMVLVLLYRITSLEKNERHASLDIAAT